MTLPATLLIANRGEIACRIIATAESLGIKTAAVYTDADKGSRHRRLADCAFLIDDYLNADSILAAAAAAAADAIHPGCGFLSESADFAELCHERGFCFIGPPPAAMRAAGSKAAARRLAAQVGIATVPGFDDTAADDAALRAAAGQIGYPLLIKAAGGGGGRGMRVVTDAAGFEAALPPARREAQSGFGDARLILEKYLPRARHLEVQLLADQHGTILTLAERDCSLQRRHQKVIEETPAANLSADCRAELQDSARRLVAAMQYSNAGTVEFLLDIDSGELYFLEVNARLQVEHPITEMIYSKDLVEWQLRVASGEALDPDEWSPFGAAMEARLCAEDPLNDFLPSSGRVYWPALEDIAARVDYGVASGDSVSEQYDSLLAKVIVWGSTRREAQMRLAAVLDEVCISGIRHNTAFIRHLLDSEEFTTARCWTAMVEERQSDWQAALRRQQDELLAFAAAARLLPPLAAFSEAGWRLNAAAETCLSCHAEGSEYLIQVTRQSSAGMAMRLQRDAQPPCDYVLDHIHLEGDAGDVWINVECQQVNRQVRLRQGAGGEWQVCGGGCTMTILPAQTAAAMTTRAENRLVAPMNAVISSIAVQEGDIVEKGAVLLTLEAMKMEIAVNASRAGRVEKVNGEVGARVEAGALLVELADESAG